MQVTIFCFGAYDDQHQFNSYMIRRKLQLKLSKKAVYFPETQDEPQRTCSIVQTLSSIHGVLLGCGCHRQYWTELSFRNWGISFRFYPKTAIMLQCCASHIPCGPFPRRLWEKRWCHCGFGSLPGTTGINTGLRHMTRSSDSRGTGVIWRGMTADNRTFTSKTGFSCISLYGPYNDIRVNPVSSTVLHIVTP